MSANRNDLWKLFCGVTLSFVLMLSIGIVECYTLKRLYQCTLHGEMSCLCARENATEQVIWYFLLGLPAFSILAAFVFLLYLCVLGARALEGGAQYEKLAQQDPPEDARHSDM
jgi:hypothetical protein